jgi:DNA-directed RNA polymerase specialized sigma24 family protein
MNSRNFTPEQTLLDRLLADDAAAFEELSRRYCYSLYTYCMGKLNSKEDSKRIVRNIFIALWEDRRTLPVNFSLSLHLYTEVRKAVVQCVNNKLNKQGDISVIEEGIIPAFNAIELQKAKQPVKNNYTKKSHTYSSVVKKRSYEEQWWNKYSPAITLKGLKHALQNMLNFW